MERKIVSIFVCMLLIATTMVFVPEETHVKADPGGGGDNEEPQTGYELMDNNTVLHIWNRYNSYYFNTSSGVQLTNHYNEYWSHNVLMLGYYDGDEWNLIYRTDELSGFNREIDTDDETYINATLWKDLSYGGYDFRLAVRYCLGVDDSDLTVIPYIRNLGKVIPYILGFGWELKDIQIGATVENDQIRVNNTRYFLNQTLDEKYTNTSGEFYLEEIDGINPAKYLYLKWDHSLDYLLWVKSRTGQYNAPVTPFIKVGTLNVDQEKYTYMHWLDAEGDYIESWNAGGFPLFGITTDWNYFWVTNYNEAEVYVYEMDGDMVDSWSTENDFPWGIATDGEYIWVTDDVSDEVYVYYMNGTWTGVSWSTENPSPRGIETDGAYIWIVDGEFLGPSNFSDYRYVSVYNMSGEYIDCWFIFECEDPFGIVTDGSYFWVTDTTDTEVYKYERDGYDGVYTDVHWDTDGCGNHDPHGITADGSYFWVTDSEDYMVYKYEGPGMAGELYERYNNSDDESIDIYGDQLIGQTFTVGYTGANENHTSTGVKLKLFRVGFPGKVTVSIHETDEFGEPTGEALTSGSTNGNSLTDDPDGEWRSIPFTLSTPYTLSESATYAIVVRALEGDAGNYLRWLMDASGPTYLGGSLAFSGDSGDNWDLITVLDCMFEEYGTIT